ncbi:MAG: YwbE family protein [Anaerolineae bacterium]|nr:YwbE family protein [Anaerolineae bacterium]
MTEATPKRSEIHIGTRVAVIEKQNQPTGVLTEGVVVKLLTKSPIHPYGIKVVLTGGKVGRVQKIVQ